MTNEQIRAFMKAGKATFTLESSQTGKHYTFRSTRLKNDGGPVLMFISLLVAPDDYQYLGTIFVEHHGAFTYKETKKSPVNPKVHAVMRFLMGNLNFDTDMESRGLIFRHEGTCAVCNRPLTTPESIDIGIGPVCREKM